jgi:hypothetical protein
MSSHHPPRRDLNGAPCPRDRRGGLYRRQYRGRACQEATTLEVLALDNLRRRGPELKLPRLSCEFMNAVPAAERWAVDAVDYEERVAREGTHLMVSEIMQADLPQEYFGGVFVSNFLEHLLSQEAVAAFLESRCDCPGGCIAILGPNFRYSREYFDLADHTVALTERTVEEHLYAAGFEILMVHPRFMPYTFTGRLPSHPLLVRAYLHLPVGWRIPGTQFLVFGERKGAT